MIDKLISLVSLTTRSSAKIAAVIICNNKYIFEKYLGMQFQTAQNQEANEDDKVRATLCVGEIGSEKDLS